MTDEITGVTPPAPGGLAAYALGSIAGPGRDAWPRSEDGRPRAGRPGAGRHPGQPGYAEGSGSPQPPGYPRDPGSPRDPGYRQDPGTPPDPPRGTRARRSGPVRGTQVAYAIVLAGLVAGLAFIWPGPHSVRAGTFILAGALFVAVAARLVLPERRAGMLASRRRYIDVTVLAILAIGLLVAGLVLPTPS